MYVHSRVLTPTLVYYLILAILGVKKCLFCEVNMYSAHSNLQLGIYLVRQVRAEQDGGIQNYRYSF